MHLRLIAAALLVISLVALPYRAVSAPRPIEPTAKIAHIVGEINRESALAFEFEMMNTASLPGDRVILIDSPGGYVDYGNEMLAAIEAEQARGVRVVCVVVSDASSMAFDILTHCNVRLATPTARMVVHKIAMGGFPTDVRMTAQHLREYADDLDRQEESFRRANAKAMHLSLKDYDYYADRETSWSSKDLLARGYLAGIVTE